MANNLISYFPEYIEKGAIFSQMATLGAPWDAEVGKEMDDAYLTMYSGVKTPSQFTKLHSVDGVALTQTIAKLLWSMNGQAWQRLWNAYTVEYTPIDNYSMNEMTERTQTNDRDISKVVDTDSTVNGTRTDTTDMTETVNGSVQHGLKVDTTQSESKSVYGFNSTEAVPSEETAVTGSETNSGTDTTTNTTTTVGTVGRESADTTKSKVTDTTSDNDSETENIQRTRKGNVGQNSFQELLKQEFDLWRWNFYTRVFEDCDKYLVLSVYDICSSVN